MLDGMTLQLIAAAARRMKINSSDPPLISFRCSIVDQCLVDHDLVCSLTSPVIQDCWTNQYDQHHEYQCALGTRPRYALPLTLPATASIAPATFRLAPDWTASLTH